MVVSDYKFKFYFQNDLDNLFFFKKKLMIFLSHYVKELAEINNNLVK